ncbi:hypothetical protein Lepto7376_0236 [[Leptolyngbya] sp. PCC 7376]|uniref:hypothetical protein n=1 Tax=[Leptolyngbya] sp. PCC 7376 TaxID=111781 RepID=UPI00029F0100|nr:hypothetical protein [[Leptolyngbya] sp. PCC 7376]AFY36680.1 hypothetical protein Lepto7376_0236 [[Leptolyngbya] sp. PCC 7376]
MAEQFNVLLKILVLSAIGSAIIKYAIPFGFHVEAIAPSSAIALVTVLLPSIVLAVLLWWRSQQDSSPVK